jgi:hypothetical protein
VVEVVNLEDKFARFSEHWSPKILARLNDYHIKAVKLRGEFVWHKHDDPDELFLVTKGVEHQPVAGEECEVLLIEPAGTPNTGDAGGARTVEPEWI